MDDQHVKDWLTAMQLTTEMQRSVEPQHNFLADNWTPNNFEDNDFDEDDYLHSETSQDLSSSDDNVDEYIFPSQFESHKLNHRDMYRYDMQQDQHQHGYLEKQKNNVKERKLPHWFRDGPFQHNLKLFPIALPGLLIMLSLGGELLLSIACVGALLIYLFHSAGYAEKSLVIYMITFVAFAMAVFYSAVPLLWKSGFNVILVFALMGYTTLSGFWILLNFEEFRKREPHLCTTIEFLLFSLYPLVMLILVSWLAVNLTSVKIGPYIIMILGYPTLQSFLQPAIPSFYNTDKGIYKDVTIIPCLTAIFIFLLFATYPCIVCFLGLLHSQLIVTLSAMAEFTFLCSCNVFMVTVFDASPLLLYLNISEKYNIYAQRTSVIISTLLFPLVLHIHGFQSLLLPFLPLILILHICFAYLLHKSNNQVLIFCFGLALIVLYTVIFSFLPWSINYYLLGDVHISMVFGIIYLNVILSIECVFAYSVFNTEEMGLSIIFQTILFVCTQKLLEGGELIPPSLVIFFSVMAVYILLRLYHWRKLYMEHVEVCVCLHMTTAISTSINIIYANHATANLLTDSTQFIVLAAFIFIINKNVLFLKLSEDITLKQFGSKMLLCCVITLVTLYFWQPRISSEFDVYQHHLAHFLVSILAVLSLIYIFYHTYV